MNYQSEQINELAQALSKAQGEFPSIPKGKKVDFVDKNGRKVFYRYADLADVIDAIKPAMTKHGLAHSQNIRICNNELVLVTEVMHSSGQWMSGAFPITLGTKPQETGSAITYARRYALCSALGIQADEDNDGELAPENKPQTRSIQTTPNPTSGKPVNQTYDSYGNRNSTITNWSSTLSNAQLQRLVSIRSTAKISEYELKEYLKSKFDKLNEKELNPTEYNEVCNLIIKGNFPRLDVPTDL